MLKIAILDDYAKVALKSADWSVLQGKAEIIISKQRNGPIGRINLAFLKNCTRFETMVEGGLPREE